MNKEIFISATQGNTFFFTAIPLFPYLYYRHTGYILDGSLGHVRIEFYVPHDFSSITEAVVVVISRATKTHRLNFGADYGGAGESCVTHIDSLEDQDKTISIRIIGEYDISGMLSYLAAGDYVGIDVYGDTVNTPNLLILGVRLSYT